MAQENFFGIDVDVEEVDANGNKKQQTEQTSSTEKECETHHRRMGWAFFKGFRALGMITLVILAVTHTLHFSIWGWIGIFMAFNFLTSGWGRRHRKFHKFHRHHFAECKCG